MKITFVVGNWVVLSGGNRVISIYADKLQNKGHEVFVVCPSKSQPSLSRQIKSLLKGKGLISTKIIGVSHFDDLDVPRQVLSHGPPITDEDLPDADIVIATWWETAEWVANLSPSKGAKAYFIQHHEVHDYIPKERAKNTYRLPLHKITIAKWLVDLMENEYEDTHVSLVPNSVDPQQFYAPPRQKQSIPTVGLLYSTAYWKGCDLTFKAIEIARQKIPELQVIAFGREEPSLTLPLPERTHYVYQPVQTTIKDLYSSCDVWLFGSLNEGFGLPILEAMACRTPVIGTPVGAAPELISKGGGLLAKLADPEDMAGAILKMVQLPDDEWQIMSQAAYKTATNYTWNDATDLFESALYKAIERTENGEL
ncbi:MAG: glycosyltransferase family 4 protein [Crocosphaera sp.]|nr:glycosyltransferase family 4 protein [Crocosphaera sp.]